MKDALPPFFIVLILYGFTAGGHLYSPDEEILFRTTRSLFEERNLDIEPMEGFATAPGRDGKQYAQYGIGQPLLALPFYAAGRLASRMGSDETWRNLYGIPADEPSGVRPFDLTARELAPRFALSFFNIVAAAALAALLYLLMNQLTSHLVASLFTTALYAFGTLAWPHSRPFFSETAAVLFILFSWYALLRCAAGPMTRWAVAAGAAAGFAALIRIDSVLLYPGLALVLLGPVRREITVLRPRVHPFIAFCVPAALCGVLLLGLNWAHFGGPFATGYGDQPEGVRFSTPLLAGLYGFLFSAGKGIFFFSPPLILGLWGWKTMARRSSYLTAGIALSIVIPLLLMSKWQNWAGGWCWGPRHIFMIHPFLAIPIAFWLAEAWGKVRRSIATSLLVVGMAVQALACSQDFMDFHRIFFRTPGRNFNVLYDAYDHQFWSQFFQITALPPGGEWTRAPIAWIPAPIQHSIYIPQSSVWRGYPKMWRDSRTLDNLWIRIIRGQ